MKKNLYTLMILALAMFVTQTVYAEEGEVSASAEVKASASVKPALRAPIRAVQKEIRDERQEIKGEARDVRVEMNQGIINDRKMMASSTASTTPAMRKEFRDDAQERRENFRNDSKEKLEQIKMESMTRIVINRLNATVTRLEKIVEKLDSRIAKSKETGTDVTVAVNASADAKLAISDARVKINLIAVPADASDNTKETIRSSVKEVEVIIKSAHGALTKAVNSLASKTIKTTTTTSIETSN
ncbi:MAG: hypothetical protein ACYCZW_02790 [Minisyncoccota bacterium]